MLEQQLFKLYLLDFSGHEPDTLHDWRFYIPIGFDNPGWWKCTKCDWSVDSSHQVGNRLPCAGCWNDSKHIDF